MAITAEFQNKSLLDKTKDVTASIKEQGAISLLGDKLDNLRHAREKLSIPLSIQYGDDMFNNQEYVDLVTEIKSANGTRTQSSMFIRNLFCGLGIHSLLLYIKDQEGTAILVDMNNRHEADFCVEIKINIERPSGIAKQFMLYALSAIDEKEFDKKLTTSIMTKVSNFTKGTMTSVYKPSLVVSEILKATDYTYEKVRDYYVKKLDNHQPYWLIKEMTKDVVENMKRSAAKVLAYNQYIPRLIVDLHEAYLDGNRKMTLSGFEALIHETGFWAEFDEGQRSLLKPLLMEAIQSVGAQSAHKTLAAIKRYDLDINAIRKMYSDEHTNYTLSKWHNDADGREVRYVYQRSTCSEYGEIVRLGSDFGDAYKVLASVLNTDREYGLYIPDVLLDLTAISLVPGDRLVLHEHFHEIIPGFEPKLWSEWAISEGRFGDRGTMYVFDDVSLLAKLYKESGLKLGLTLAHVPDSAIDKVDPDTANDIKTKTESYHARLVDLLVQYKSTFEIDEEDDELRRAASEFFSAATHEFVEFTPGDKTSVVLFADSIVFN